MQWLTEKELQAQPKIWSGWSGALQQHAEEIQNWIKGRRPDAIWLCGAGTSAFIADAIAVYLDGCIDGIPVRNVASTDLVARPTDYLKNGVRPLVVSFGRSGNSSESVGTINVLDRLCPGADRLNITCNAKSTLATCVHAGPGEQKIILLPEETHDQGFAMTSSFTTMLLTSLACLSAGSSDEIDTALRTLSGAADLLLDHPLGIERPQRAVFLGSGAFLGTARESALKVLELAAGKVVTSWDSTLGFRHGPKAVTNGETCVFVFLSSDELTRKYDDDIAAEIRSQFADTRVVSIGVPHVGETPDIPVQSDLADVWNTVLYVIIAQRLSVEWSKSLGLNVDNPFEGGNLSRVVSHVQLYE